MQSQQTVVAILVFTELRANAAMLVAFRQIHEWSVIALRLQQLSASASAKRRGKLPMTVAKRASTGNGVTFATKTATAKDAALATS